MSARLPDRAKIRITWRHALGLILSYLRQRLAEQARALALIVVYLVVFQTMVLGISVTQASTIAVGLVVTVLGLMFFMEGLLLGLMPLGEVAGVQLPQRAKLPPILLFGFLLGVGATFAEPAIGVLKAAGSSVKPWGAPLLYLLLNRYAPRLVLFLGLGVGLAVICGMLRFFYGVSLKRFLYVLVPLMLGISIWACADPNLALLTAIAWDCGAITTGPVTVPLVVSLGVGITRAVGRSGSGMAGFGVVTLASLVPVATVLLLGLPLIHEVPAPMPEAQFFAAETREKALYVFGDREEMLGYAFRQASEASQVAMFDGDRGRMLACLRTLRDDPALCRRLLGPGPDALERWAAARGTRAQQEAVFGAGSDGAAAALKWANLRVSDAGFESGIVRRSALDGLRAVLPLTVYLVVVLTVLLRERLRRARELFLGIGFAVVGMALFLVGIEFGIGKLGGQIGSLLPSAFREIRLTEQRTILPEFDPAAVQTAVTPSGAGERFFFAKVGGAYVPVPYEPSAHDEAGRRYVLTPSRGPLFTGLHGWAGILVLFGFAFVMGYAATQAEPALNALGIKVEELTAGVFKRVMLVQAVGVGVGVGMIFGLVKILWGVPFVVLLVPPCLLALIITRFSTDDFVNLGWDSAGVTTGPITTPLVLAMGLGLGSQLGTVEGFGILTMAAVWPILSVLIVGLAVTRRRQQALKRAAGLSRGRPAA